MWRLASQAFLIAMTRSSMGAKCSPSLCTPQSPSHLSFFGGLSLPLAVLDWCWVYLGQSETCCMLRVRPCAALPSLALISAVHPEVRCYYDFLSLFHFSHYCSITTFLFSLNFHLHSLTVHTQPHPQSCYLHIASCTALCTAIFLSI